MDGTGPVLMKMPPGNYHVAVRHRNHFGVMTSTAIANAFAVPGWTGRAWMDVTADFGSDLKIMNLIRDPSNTLNNMSCESAMAF